MSVLIAYGTVEGQTGKIADFIRSLAQEAGETAEVFDTSDKTGEVSFEGVDKVILAASVHERRHPRPFELFVSANAEELTRCKTLLLSVSLSAAFPEGHADAQDYSDEMKMRTGLEPDAELLVAGAVRSERYDFYAAQVVRHVVMRGRDFDPSVTRHEFTDWDELEAKVRDFLKSSSS